MSDVIHVAVGVIVGADQKILISRRSPDAHQGDLWEFPGGKLENDETVLVALQRELQEELGIDIDPDQCYPLKKILHHYHDRSILLDIWRVDSFRGEPSGREQQDVKWQSVDALDQQDFPAANRAIISALQLPSILAITGECAGREEFRARFSALLAKGIKLIQFRQPILAGAELLEWVSDAAQLCRENNARFQLNGSVEEFNQLNAHGLHVNATLLLELESRPVSGESLFSASCHNLVELLKAEQLGADFVLLSPIKTTRSHPHAQPLGWEQFKALASQVSIPVYALGGMTPEDLEPARKAGGHGIAAISAVW